MNARSRFVCGIASALRAGAMPFVMIVLVLSVAQRQDVMGQSRGHSCLRTPSAGLGLRKPADELLRVDARMLVEAARFRLRIDDGAKFFSDPTPWGSTTLGQRRLGVVRQVFVDMAWALGVHEPADTARCVIDITTTHDGADPGAAWAEPAWVVGPAERNVVVDVAPLSFLRYGHPPPEELQDPGRGYGRITINASKRFGVEDLSCPDDAVDLYSVILHELMHVLGVASIVGMDCREPGPKIPVPFASRWDALLESSAGPVLTAGTEVLHVMIPPGAAGARQVKIVRTPTSSRFYIVPDGTANDCAVDLSHIAEATGDTSVMAATFEPGVMRRALFPTDVYALRSLGYDLKPWYGEWGTPHHRRLGAPALLPSGTVSSVRSVTLMESRYRRFTAATRAVSPYSALDVHLISGNVVSRDPRVRVQVESDSIVVYLRDASMRASCIRLLATDTLARAFPITLVTTYGTNQNYRIDDLPCPPNAICNGDFEIASRSGEIVNSAPRPGICGDSTNVANWRFMEASSDLFRVEPYTRSYDFGDSFVQQMVSAFVANGWAFPRGYELNSANRSYVGSISGGTTGGPSDYFEGIKQRVYLTANVSQRLVLWAYTKLHPTHDWTRNSGILIRISDSLLCGVRSCSDRGGTVVDTVLILPTPNTWVPLWTSPFRVPIDGWYDVGVSSTNCFLSQPNYYQGTTGYVLFDDVQLIGGALSTEVVNVPNVPCRGDTVTLRATFTNTTDRTVTATWKLNDEPDARYTVVGPGSGQIAIPARTSLPLSLVRVALSQTAPDTVQHRILVWDDQTGSSVVDTLPVTYETGTGPLGVRWLSAQWRNGVFEASAQCVNTRTQATPCRGRLTWSHAATDSVELVLDDASPLRVSSIVRTGPVTYWEIDGFLPTGTTSLALRATVHARRRDLPASDSARVGIVFGTTGSTCEAASALEHSNRMVTFEQAAAAWASPIPALDVVRISVGAEAGALQSVRLVDAKGATHSRTQLPAGSIGSFTLNVEDLPSGLYLAVVDAENGPIGVRFIVAR